MKTLALVLFALLGSVACAQTATVAPDVPQNTVAPAPTLPPELLEPRLLSEVARYLYHWYVDESDIEQVSNTPDVAFWLGVSTPANMDEGDKSVFAKVLLPRLGITVQLKKSDYFIEETKVAVKSNGFKITSVSRGLVPPAMPAGYIEIKLNMEKLKEHLFATRYQMDYPQETLITRLKASLVAELSKEKTPVVDNPTEDQTVYVGSISPVANDLWAYWENKKWLVHCTSDIDLANPTVWSQETLKISIFDTLTQVVVSTEEAAGSNRFMTRGQIGRALYNCIVLGKHIQITPSQKPPAPTAPSPSSKPSV